jgi:hypothetical protein
MLDGPLKKHDASPNADIVFGDLLQFGTSALAVGGGTGSAVASADVFEGAPRFRKNVTRFHQTFPQRRKILHHALFARRNLVEVDVGTLSRNVGDWKTVAIFQERLIDGLEFTLH